MNFTEICWTQKGRAGEPANFLVASAPDFFFQASLASDFFLKQLRLPLQEAKNTRLQLAPAPDYWLSLAKYSFPCKLVR